ncbi:MAG: hypothetical protein E6R03_15070 [Hyphomicrobiaceae bacterium]|nr:MAG: hypothetical protein E6R03_15070 [Hyphomicrobiaceae bacterium]
MAKQVGIMASAASCGTSITEGQIDAMVAAGFKRINIVYDNEPQGQMASFSNLSKFGGREGLYLSVMFLPFDENVPLPERDPDTFLRTKGKDAYFEVKPITAFDQRLNCLMDAGLNGLQVAEDMVKLIVNEPSKVRQGEMIQTLSTRTGVKEEDIRSEITRITDKRVLSITETLSKRLALSRDARERIDLIKNSTLELGQFNEEKDADLSFEESAMAFQTTCSKFEKAVDGIGGWDTGWKFFNESFDGLPKNGQIIGVPGASNCGKSAWITTLATNLLQKNPDGPVVVFHSLDDPRETAFAKLLSCVTGLPIRFITRVAKYGTADKAVKETYERAKAWVLQCMAEKRLVVKGQEIGNGTKVTQKLIDQAHSISGRNVVYVGDSLHSLDDQASHDERVKFKRVAEWTMMMTETRPLTMVFTVELRKAGMQGRPKLADLAESGKLIYAMKAIGFFYSELHDLRQAAKKFWVDSGRDPSTNMVLPPVKRPIIEVDWIKNKVTEFKGLSHLKLYDHIARVEELTDQDLTKELESAKTLMNERTESNFAPGAAVRRPQNVFFSPLPAGKNGN